MTEQSWQVQGYLETRAGRLTIDGVDAAQLADEHGTPLYVFSEKRIMNNVFSLRLSAEAVFPRVKLCYASKANSNMAVLDAVRRAGGDVEVNSGGELFKAKTIGFRPDQIVFNGVSKTDDEIRDAIQYGILAINVDSLYEIEQVARVARSINKRANIAIRIVPEIVTRSHIGLQTGLLSSKFGLSPSQIEEAFSRSLAAGDAINLAGVHIHVGSQTPDPHPFARAFAEMWLFLVDLHKRTGHRLSHINIGGGLPVDYLPDTPMVSDIGERERQMLSAELDPTEVLKAALAEAITDDTAPLLEGLTIVMEPGRRIIGDTGLLLTRVCNIKERPETGDTWLLTDAGYSLMLSINTYKWYYHLISATRAEAVHNTPYKVAGPLCDSGDVYFDIERGTRLPNYRLLPEGTNVGDVLALLNTGAYALDQASQYNGRPIPAVVMVKESGEVKVVRRRETYEDLYSKDEW
ncbi:MAG TPA: diaminopimelate decarboxylase [Blastocatellia bacterium]|nr:diaminopimelate decarboxylase [Blastocatellia bacterium]